MDMGRHAAPGADVDIAVGHEQRRAEPCGIGVVVGADAAARPPGRGDAAAIGRLGAIFAGQIAAQPAVELVAEAEVEQRTVANRGEGRKDRAVREDEGVKQVSVDSTLCPFSQMLVEARPRSLVEGKNEKPRRLESDGALICRTTGQSRRSGRARLRLRPPRPAARGRPPRRSPPRARDCRPRP